MLRLLWSVLMLTMFLTMLAHAQPDYLQPEQAFRLSVSKQADQQVRLTWDIAKGYYLHRKQMKVEADPAGSAQQVNWPAGIKALEAKGLETVGTFDAPGGLTGYAGMLQQQPLAVYVTSDGKQTIVGSMVDAKGADLTREPVTRLVSKPMGDKTLKLLEQSAWIGADAKTAPRVVYAFTDPNCPYCNKFWNDAQPWIKAGKVQVRHVIVGILGPTSSGKAAALMSAPDPQAALALHETRHRSGGIKPLAQVPANVRTQLEANQNLMQQLGFSATPATLFKDADGNLQTVMGAPTGDKLKQVLGPL